MPQVKVVDVPKKLRSSGKKLKGSGTARGFTLEELPKIIKRICTKYPNITYIEIRGNEISWHFECAKDDLLKKKKKNTKIINPSRRDVDAVS